MSMLVLRKGLKTFGTAKRIYSEGVAYEAEDLGDLVDHERNGLKTFVPLELAEAVEGVEQVEQYHGQDDSGDIDTAVQKQGGKAGNKVTLRRAPKAEDAKGDEGDGEGAAGVVSI